MLSLRESTKSKSIPKSEAHVKAEEGFLENFE